MTLASRHALLLYCTALTAVIYRASLYNIEVEQLFQKSSGLRGLLTDLHV